MTQWIPSFVRWERECLPSNIQKSEMKDDYYVFFGEPSFNKNVPIPDDDFFDVMTTFWQQRRRKKEKKIVDGFHGALECQGYMRRDVIWLLLLFAKFLCKNTRKRGIQILLFRHFTCCNNDPNWKLFGPYHTYHFAQKRNQSLLLQKTWLSHNWQICEEDAIKNIFFPLCQIWELVK